MTRTVARSDAVEAIVAQAAVAPGRLVILLDGGSGAGKTVLANEIAARIEGLQVVHLDDVYPGWYGLDAASHAVTASALPA